MSHQDFKDYVSQSIQKIRQTGMIELEERKAFAEKYPLSRIAELTIEEYCLGTDKYKDSLSYLIEFGKIGFGVGGGSSRKHGVYFSKKDNCYMHGADPISDINEFWPKFRTELYQFLKHSGESDTPLKLEDYPLLQGMAIVLTKYLSLYFPQKYMTIGSTRVLRNLMDAFGYPYDDAMRCHQLNCLLTARLRKDFPELREEDGSTIGNLAWDYIDGESIKIHSTSETESFKGSGLGDEDVRPVHYWSACRETGL